jgi:hypothetical protein
VKNDEHGSLAITILPRKGIGLVTWLTWAKLVSDWSKLEKFLH